ncbi:glycosyl hydrolase family 18 protein [Clostridium grantii]|uniref:Spore germination protein n=1 Tax=Clostridium grantii DSM 8605 TaxID=1121316 RepID=A0A1M5V7Q3_9CLOT|nr:glycoside hydrolase family 18 protein [Clostridium grantii]SHH71299.1 spore germination protein [Clostridium grantii DSM 8605]
MQIHVVKSGDTLWSISKMYSFPLDQLIAENNIPNPSSLVIGQTLVVPIWGQYHFVKKGETLYSIGILYDISPFELMRINGIINPFFLGIGTRLYIPAKPRFQINTAGYVDPKITGVRSGKEVDKVAENLTYVNIFTYAANRDGTLTPTDDTSSINSTYRQGALPLMVLSNFENGTFTPELATDILTNPILQDKLLNESIKIMKKKGYQGLDFDFEYLGIENKERYNAFLRKAKNKLKENNYFISTALAPKISADQKGTLYEGHDYKANGEIVDFIFFMTYEWGWSGGPPMAVSPINKVEQVLQYALTEVPKDKIMMGIPLYGYDWTLPYVKGGRWAKSIGPQDAILLAKKYNVSIEYDTISQSPYFNYYDENKKKHEVWFEDARSIQAKFDLVKKLGIKGFFYWVLGRDFPQNWLLIKDNFIVKKTI